MRRASVLRGYERQISGRQGNHTHLLDFAGFCGGGLIHDCKKCPARRYHFEGRGFPFPEPSKTIWRERNDTSG